MVILGIDFGSETCVVTSIDDVGFNRAKHPDFVLNDNHNRITPSYVAFTERKREIGNAAKSQHSTNINGTIFDFKHLLGVVRNEVADNFYNVGQHEDGTIKVLVNCRNMKCGFKVEQIAAMLLKKLRCDAINHHKVPSINDCVIAVPSYFTNDQRNALYCAAVIAELNCYDFITEPLAVAINYSFFKQFLTQSEKLKNVIFVDFGASSIQISAFAFGKNLIKTLGTSWAMIGGRDIDKILLEYFISKANIKIPDHEKWKLIELMNEVEELKKKLSASSSADLRSNIQATMNVVDSQLLSMKRSQMEEICVEIFSRIEKLYTKFLAQFALKLEDVDSIEIVGGSSRIPAVKNLINKVFGQQPKTTMNQDEAVSRGCSLYLLLRRGIVIKNVNAPSNANMYQFPTNLSEDREVRNYSSICEMKNFQLMENELAAFDLKEDERRDAFNELENNIIKLENETESGESANLLESERKEVKELLKCKHFRNEQTEDFVEKSRHIEDFLNSLKVTIKNRCDARNNLEEFIINILNEMKPNGEFFDLMANESKSLLYDLKLLNNCALKTTEQYNNELRVLQEKVSRFRLELNERRRLQKEIIDFISTVRKNLQAGELKYLNKSECKDILNNLEKLGNIKKVDSFKYDEELKKQKSRIEHLKKLCIARKSLIEFVQETGDRLNSRDFIAYSTTDEQSEITSMLNDCELYDERTTTEEYETKLNALKQKVVDVERKIDARLTARNAFVRYISDLEKSRCICGLMFADHYEIKNFVETRKNASAQQAVEKYSKAITQLKEIVERISSDHQNQSTSSAASYQEMEYSDNEHHNEQTNETLICAWLTKLNSFREEQKAHKNRKNFRTDVMDLGKIVDELNVIFNKISLSEHKKWNQIFNRMKTIEQFIIETKSLKQENLVRKLEKIILFCKILRTELEKMPQKDGIMSMCKKFIGWY